MRQSAWHNCYTQSWKKGAEIVPEAFAHPAKFSRALIARIYRHITDEGWVEPEGTILDPFGGVALGGLEAGLRGLRWVGVELEPRFVALGRKNIALWSRRFGQTGVRWVEPILLQGDSRRLGEVVREAGCVVGSPPFCDQIPQQDKDFRVPHDSTGHLRGDYGTSPGQLGAMPAGDFDGVIASPPYAAQASGSGGLNTKPARHRQGWAIRYKLDAIYFNRDLEWMQGGLPPGPLFSTEHEAASRLAMARSEYFTWKNREVHGSLNWKEGEAEWRPLGMFTVIRVDEPDQQSGRSLDSPSQDTDSRYGDAAGQLARMPEGAAVVVSSPPYEASDDRRRPHGGKVADGEAGFRNHYSDNPLNLGNPQGVDVADTFWSAARQIVAQCHAVLRPGGHAVWVVKHFIRKGQLVDFPAQWQAMCESAGFETLHAHQAWFCHWDYKRERLIWRKSFFRRLAESKGSPRIDWETVLCMYKPDTY